MEAGILQVIEFEDSHDTHGIWLLTGGVAIRLGRNRTVTVRGQYGDSYKRAHLYSVHLGFEFGR